ncbi:E3 ubiquitin-protein ligase lubel-like isoform X1 [Frankliniella occidentalis]|uniref:E3 ubiquitin-protein ligase lubel-like isoform X1 n=1 Tax=Frankliniella occidentalis TaxID=133901 RepID=A0A6J1TSM1_FRAOC|nr:E3 ubiquitin-protein ligase lubel-like isoform X1 [Frankliniella occidentalis]
MASMMDTQPQVHARGMESMLDTQARAMELIDSQARALASMMDTQENEESHEYWPKWDRKEQIKMRYSGQEYVSKSGKVIPAKKQPELICTCPQKCGDKISPEARERLFKEFYRLADHALQNRFLQAHIEIRAVQRKYWRQQQRTPSGRSQRRVSCKYQVPMIQSASDVTFDGRTKPGIPIVEVCQKAFMNVYAITEKRVRIQRERLIVQAQELAAANGDSPLQPMDTLSLLASRTAPAKLQSRGGENYYQQSRSQEAFASRLASFGKTNLTITPSRVPAAPMTNPRDLMSKLSDRDITMVPAHAYGSLSIMPMKRDSFPLKNSSTNGKTNRDITMIPLKHEEASEEPTDLSMPTDLSVRKRSMAKDLSNLNIPSATSIVPVVSSAPNLPVDLSVKSSRPKIQPKSEYKYQQYPIAKKYKPDIVKKQEYESEAEMDGDEMDEMDMEPGTEAGMDGDMAMEQAYEPETESEMESRPGATPDSLSSHSVHADDRHDSYVPRPEALPFFFQPNINDIAMVNSFFLNQLWQPEFIDTELLREYHRKQEELKEKKKQQRKMSKIKATEGGVNGEEHELENDKATEKNEKEDEGEEKNEPTEKLENEDEKAKEEEEVSDAQETKEEESFVDDDEAVEAESAQVEEPNSEDNEKPTDNADV